jgi:hypothetical protein
MIRAFLQGAFEFRHCFTSRLEYPLDEAYDWGREIAHRLTFRRFEELR